jgi:predicted negative regulator of RcsB-dependent stress response
MSNEILKTSLQKNFSNFIKKNFKVILVFLAIIFILLFVFLFYKNIQEKNNIKIAEKYTQASLLIKQKKISQSKLLLEDIINKDHQFYSPLALYLIIDNKIEDDNAKIIVFFDQVLKNNSISKENLNIIKIKKAIYLINTDEEEKVIKTLNPIINSNSAWRRVAINLLTDYFISKNQTKKAEEYIQLLNSEIIN